MGTISPIFWICAIVVFLVIEAAVPGLVSLWFAVGALPALLASAFHAENWLQVTLFLVSTAAALILGRPLAQKYVNNRVQPTNADVVIGKECVVLEKVDNLHSTGAVSIGGKVWTARTESDDEIIEEKAIATVLRIDGVKLIVARKTEE